MDSRENLMIYTVTSYSSSCLTLCRLPSASVLASLVLSHPRVSAGFPSSVWNGLGVQRPVGLSLQHQGSDATDVVTSDPCCPERYRSTPPVPVIVLTFTFRCTAPVLVSVSVLLFTFRCTIPVLVSDDIFPLRREYYHLFNKIGWSSCYICPVGVP